METRYEYSRSAYTYHDNYVRNTKAVGVLWGLFTICFAILNILVFTQQHWLGSTSSGGSREGRIGLYQVCRREDGGAEAALSSDGLRCEGSFDSFSTSVSPYFTASTILVGVSALLVLVAVACMLLFFFLESRTVYCLCSWIQFLSFCCITAGVLSFPVGWDAGAVREICGHRAGVFAPGSCEFRWAFVLAIIGCVDILFLTILGWVLACRAVPPLPKLPPAAYRGESNIGFNGVYARGPTIAPMESESHIDQRFKHYGRP